MTPTHSLSLLLLPDGSCLSLDTIPSSLPFILTTEREVTHTRQLRHSGERERLGRTPFSLFPYSAQEGDFVPT